MQQSAQDSLVTLVKTSDGGMAIMCIELLYMAIICQTGKAAVFVYQAALRSSRGKPCAQELVICLLLAGHLKALLGEDLVQLVV